MIMKYAKFLAALLGVAVLVVNGLADDGSLSTDEIVAIVSAGGAALAVFGVKNKVV